jgi:hypothetical protein
MASSRGILNIQSLNELTSENPILRMQNRHDFVCGPWDLGASRHMASVRGVINIQTLTSSRPRMGGFTSK